MHGRYDFPFCPYRYYSFGCFLQTCHGVDELGAYQLGRAVNLPPFILDEEQYDWRELVTDMATNDGLVVYILRRKLVNK